MEQPRDELREHDAEVGLDLLLSALKRKGIPLPSEIGAFLVLEACEQLLDAPVRLRSADLVIGEIGEITVMPGAARVSQADGVRAMLVLLGDLLVCSAPGVPEMLLALVEHGPSDPTIERLRDELEACLLPLNRGATRRILSRMLREARKSGERSSTRPRNAPDGKAVDAELDALLGLSPAPEASPAQVRELAAAIPSLPAQAAQPNPAPAVLPDVLPPPAPPSVGIARLHDDRRDVNTSDPPPTRARPHRAEAAFAADGGEADSAPVTTPMHASAAATAATALPAPRAPRGPAVHTDLLFEAAETQRGLSGGVVLGGLLVIVAVVLATAYLLVGQQAARRLLGMSETAKAARSAAATPTPVNAAVRVGELQVGSTPARAQVFLWIGNGPALATDLPIGVAQEFVALADGRAPARAVVPSDAVWEKGAGQPRYELAMQTGKEAGKGDELDLGPTLLSHDVGTPTGSLGTVRVITAPPGARVYQLIGFTPEVRVENLPLDHDYELLVYLKGHQVVRRHLDAADFHERDGKRVASVEMQLSPRHDH